MFERQLVLLVIDLDFEDSDICFPLLLYHINPSARKLFFFFPEVCSRKAILYIKMFQCICLHMDVSM